ncbi:MAG: Gfo/Idh/MocA family oxidoreductase [Ideonella sp.]
MNPRIFGIGVVGTGIMGQRMTAALAHHPRFRVAALWDPDATALQAASAITADARRADGLIELVGDPACDLIYVAAPPAAHRAIVQAALAAGRACLCEKPLAADRSEADAMAALVATSGLPFAVNFPLARSAASRQLAALVHTGTLGKIESATIELRFARWPRQWQAGAAAWLDGSAEGGFSREVLSHFVFLAERLFGPAQVFATRLTRQPGRAESALQASLQHADVTLQIDAAVAGDVADHNRFEIVGSKATAALTGWTRLEYGGQLSERVDPTPGTLDGVAAMLDGQTDHGLATAAEAASVVRCIEAMLTSKQPD